jgi:prevent-host-death family protein
MIRINIHEVKAQLSKYIDMVEAGDTVIVCRRNIPVAEIRPIENRKVRKPVLGSAKGLGVVPEDFNEPLTAEELRSWYGTSNTDPLKKLAGTRKKKERRK